MSFRCSDLYHPCVFVPPMWTTERTEPTDPCSSSLTARARSGRPKDRYYDGSSGKARPGQARPGPCVPPSSSRLGIPCPGARLTEFGSSSAVRASAPPPRRRAHRDGERRPTPVCPSSSVSGPRGVSQISGPMDRATNQSRPPVKVRAKEGAAPWALAPSSRPRTGASQAGRREDALGTVRRPRCSSIGISSISISISISSRSDGMAMGTWRVVCFVGTVESTGQRQK
ncbi:hypothetical protein JDV02_000219 [Purpureocillium takamizusanense]|uniref:Uncharacterized protein n=1 Tax=Purpureocillium takamizusanense TaxID=2060973 RepID=A0A9Q8V6M4_9HYPO|nr:uncharacterized protein JDV02_000219 [Purpureocillium takamizusanense]UNI13476.1 hypothetical protein JDV02_000219 [Purpureocillium takamizusanense]